MKQSQATTIDTICKQITDMLLQHIENAEKTAIETFVEEEKKTQPEVKFSIATSYTIGDHSKVKTTLKYRATFGDETEDEITHNQTEMDL